MKRVWVYALWVWLIAATASAEPMIDVAHELQGVVLGRKLSVWVDETDSATIDDVSAPAHAQAFAPITRDVPAFGFSPRTHWFRLVVRNSGSTARAWLAELDFPQLDYVTLYVPQENGTFERRAVGDRRPFEERDLAYRTFIFTLEEPARGTRVYYLSVKTSGALALPLTAWTVMEFLEHQHLDWAGLCIFYGVVLVMSCYSFGLFLFTRDRQFLTFAAMVLCSGLFQFCYVGHAAQFLSGQFELVQVVAPIAGALWMMAGTCMARDHFAVLMPWSGTRRAFDGAFAFTVFLLVVSACAPVRVSLRLLVITLLVQGLLTIWVLVRAARSAETNVRLLVFGWAALNIGAVTIALKVTGFLPSNLFTQWSVQLGASLQFVSIATANAFRLNQLRAELATLNEELEVNVQELGHAVMRAKRAHTLAARATLVKDEFLATMSHELRTPLNAIINIPQGLILEFPLEERVVCSQCKSHFELELDETFDGDAACPECASLGSLAHKSLVHYYGEPARTLRYIEKLERSGKHLLKVVHGILQADRDDRDRVELAYEIVDPVSLAHDVAEDLSPLAERAGVLLVVTGKAGAAPQSFDALRMRQVLINLVGNAIKFSNGQGTVTLGVEATQHACTFTVSDQGVGIPEDRLTDVFETYTQVHANGRFGGTGLGLAISRDLVRAHGGELSVQSELGHGSVFTCKIPRRESAEPTRAERSL